MEWVLELALIGFLAATLFHALRLERALGVLKRDRAALEDLVLSFNSSTKLAEQGIDRLRTTADGVGRQLSRQVDTGTSLKDDLMFLVERGDGLADRLEKLIRTGQHGYSEPPPVMREPLRAERSPASHDISAGDETGPRLRSQAERDLLKALRMAR